MIIGVKVHGNSYGKERANEYLKTYLPFINEELQRSSFKRFFVSFQPNLVFFRTEVFGEEGGLFQEYRKHIAINPALSGMETESGCVFDLEEVWSVEFDLPDLRATFYLDTSSFDLKGEMQAALEGKAFHPITSASYNVPEKLSLALDVEYKLLVKAAGYVLDGEKHDEGIDFSGGVSLHVERELRASEGAGKEIYRALMNVMEGKSEGAGWGLDTEVRNLRDIMEKSEKRRMINSLRVASFEPPLLRHMLFKKEPFSFKLINGKIEISKSPMSVKLFVEVNES